MNRSWGSLFLFALLLLLAGSSNAEDLGGEFDREEYGSGFVAIEGGQWRLLGAGRNVVTNPTMLYVTTGFSFTKALERAGDYEPLKIGPKIGIGFGEEKGTNLGTKLFYDLLAKIRYTFGREGTPLRPYVDAGPGFVNFRSSAFEMEGGAGLDVHFAGGSAGVNVQYKELIGGGMMKRGIVLLGSIAYRF